MLPSVPLRCLGPSIFVPSCEEIHQNLLFRFLIEENALQFMYSIANFPSTQAPIRLLSVNTFLWASLLWFQIKQESPPVWTQEAYRPLHSHSKCLLFRGGYYGYPPTWTWDGVPPYPDLGWGTPPLPGPGMGYPPYLDLGCGTPPT